MFRLSSRKIRLSGDPLQISGLVLPGGPTRTGLSWNSVPAPFSGVKADMKADRRKILSVPGVGPGPDRIPALIFQFGSLVRPALTTGGAFEPLVAKPMTAESKMKSP